ncbi:uncharacterized protein LOC110696910 [Chenopodium quinoa]|uniref:uncharacterized protein LOC110696910 n=1 Tax=Chenopodium quinoa TaxID=63459 RepID=UPI000B785D63|nr:uncharacterized protein LOC110696910 [Chenopodium quinoa]
MAEEITNLYTQLDIRDDEKKPIDLGTLPVGEEENNLSLMLVGKLLTQRSYNIEVFKKTMTTPIHGLAIRVLSPNLYAFQFFHWKDYEKVLKGRPLCFDNMLVLLKGIDGDEQPEDVILRNSPFWVRIKNLPFNCRTDAHVRAILEGMGEILEMEDDILGIGRYRRVKIMLDTSKPLRRFQMIKDRQGRELQVNLAYERLPFFFFACGIMGHAERDCHNVEEEKKQEQLGWGMNLKATLRKGLLKELEELENLKANMKLSFTPKPHQEERGERRNSNASDHLGSEQITPSETRIIAPPPTSQSSAPIVLEEQVYVFGDHETSNSSQNVEQIKIQSSNSIRATSIGGVLGRE